MKLSLGADEVPTKTTQQDNIKFLIHHFHLSSNSRTLFTDDAEFRCDPDQLQRKTMLSTLQETSPENWSTVRSFSRKFPAFNIEADAPEASKNKVENYVYLARLMKSEI